MDIATIALTPVSEGPEPASVSDAQFSADGRSVYLITNRDNEFEQLRRVDLLSGAAEVLTGHIPWDIDSFARSDDGRYLAWVANVDGVSRLTVVDVARRAEILPPLADGRIGRIGFDPAGKRLAITLESPQSPRDVYVLEVERNVVVRYTRSEAGTVDPLQFVAAELIRFPTFDRVNGGNRKVPAFVYRPKDQPGPRPVLIDIHGGPESQAVPGFNPFTQFLVREMGFAVITPNVRGSSGYGKTYLNLDNGEDREDAVKDIGALLVWIGAQRNLDAKRVFVSGGSYGGYMSLASLVHYSDRLRGGIDVVGISNFVTFLESTSAYRRNLRRPEYGDERLTKMRAYLNRISPLNNAARISKPLLVVQGLNDPRVPASESQQMVAKIRGRGGEVLVSRGEGRRPWLSQESQPRLLPEDDRDVPRETAGRAVAPSVRGKEEALLGHDVERGLLARVVSRQLLDIFGGQLRSHAGHDGVLAPASLVVDQRALEVVLVLAGNRRIVGGDADTVGAVAGHADFARLGTRGGRHIAHRLGEHLVAGEIDGDVRHVPLAHAAGLGMHGAVRALAALVGLERCHQVFGPLAAQLGHRVRRVHVFVVRNRMAAHAGVGQVMAAPGVAGRRRASVPAGQRGAEGE